MPAFRGQTCSSRAEDEADLLLAIADCRLQIHGVTIGDCGFGLQTADSWNDDWRLRLRVFPIANLNRQSPIVNPFNLQSAICNLQSAICNRQCRLPLPPATGPAPGCLVATMWHKVCS